MPFLRDRTADSRLDRLNLGPDLNVPKSERVIRNEPGEEPTAFSQLLSPFTRWESRSVRVLGVLLLGSLLIVGWGWWSGNRSEGVPTSSDPSQGLLVDSQVATDTGVTAPVSEVVVHVAGAVKKPGLIRLPSGSRVADAVEAAGGAAKPRDLDSVNLARVLVDGEQILVGKARSESGSTGINVNSASAKELEELPGVGPVLAQRIIDWRTANGPFTSVDDLNSVPGIGDSVLANIKPLVTV